jgi:hypothetical protein
MKKKLINLWNEIPYAHRMAITFMASIIAFVLVILGTLMLPSPAPIVLLIIYILATVYALVYHYYN